MIPTRRPLPRLRDARDTVSWGRQLVEELQQWLYLLGTNVGVGGPPTGAAGGDLGGTYPNPSVTNDSHAHTASTITVGHGDLATGLAIATSNHTMATSRLLGRTTASTGAIEEITVGTGLSLATGTLTATGGGGDPWDFDEGSSTETYSVGTIDFDEGAA